jgi:hypothetical protein
LHDLELNAFSLFQGFESFSLQRRIMHEHIIPALKTNEPKSLAIVEPFDGTFCLHGNTPFLNDHGSLRGRSRNSAGDGYDDKEKKKEATSVGIMGSCGATTSFTKPISVQTSQHVS